MSGDPGVPGWDHVAAMARVHAGGPPPAPPCAAVEHGCTAVFTCALDAGHDGVWHRRADGQQWAVVTPREGVPGRLVGGLLTRLLTRPPVHP